MLHHECHRNYVRSLFYYETEYDWFSDHFPIKIAYNFYNETRIDKRFEFKWNKLIQIVYYVAHTMYGVCCGIETWVFRQVFEILTLCQFVRAFARDVLHPFAISLSSSSSLTFSSCSSFSAPLLFAPRFTRIHSSSVICSPLLSSSRLSPSRLFFASTPPPHPPHFPQPLSALKIP